MRRPLARTTRARARAAVLPLVAVALGAACAAPSASDGVGVGADRVSPEDRMLIGEAERYPGDAATAALAPALARSMKARRDLAWSVVAKVVAPVPLAAPKLDPADPEVSATLPRFATWYGRSDVVAAFDRLWLDADRGARPFRACEVDAVFRWAARDRPQSLSTWNRDVYRARRAELGTPEGASSLGRNTRVLMSPAFVAHLLTGWGELAACAGRTFPLGQPPLGPDNHTRCMPSEMPADAAVVKAGWEPDASAFPAFDTDAASVARVLETGTWPSGRPVAPPGPDAIYTLRALTPTPEVKRLAALHVATKELRDWLWITLFWSDTPDQDFGADRPASLPPPWSHYKMLVVTDYDELDPDPGAEYADSAPSLAAALRAAHGPRTWASNPYVEREARNGATNCIGCHAHGGTRLSVQAVLDDEATYPDSTRRRARSAFPADYTWVTASAGLDLGALFKSTRDGARVPAALPGPGPAPCE